MKSIRRIVTLSAVILLAQMFATISCFGEQLSFNLEGSNISLNVPKGWTAVEGLFGMPLMINGPEKDNFRPTVSITPVATDVKIIEFDDPEKEEKDFREGRISWLEEVNGKLVDWLPLTKVSLNSQVKGYEAGLRYTLAGQKAVFSSRITYAPCGGTLYLLKSLFTQHEEKAYKKTVDDIYRSISCK
ncbi:hypothetical protein OR1_03493 [Geobacter sp. OR-1]|uniref:hypothetical protein n=1 Tax=Geobacter sp. OR-1 TaxID=1266765 RepID=UPI000543CD30|nr:hypothetical protein [Geobacter sp. OR-1]GAM11183.1 hypothetical protein OR1_03493 [Geobacter sp. OR-1]